MEIDMENGKLALFQANRPMTFATEIDDTV